MRHRRSIQSGVWKFAVGASIVFFIKFKRKFKFQQFIIRVNNLVRQFIFRNIFILCRYFFVRILLFLNNIIRKLPIRNFFFLFRRLAKLKPAYRTGKLGGLNFIRKFNFILICFV